MLKFVGTKHEDGLKQPKSVSRTAKVYSFVGFGLSQPKIVYVKLPRSSSFVWLKKYLGPNLEKNFDKIFWPEFLWQTFLSQPQLNLN